MRKPGQEHDEIDTAAAQWAARLGGGPLNRDERRNLDRWLQSSLLHRAALEESRTAWAKMGLLRRAPGALALDAAPSRRSMPAGWKPMWMRATAFAACLLVALWGGTSFWLGSPLTSLTADYRTAPGEHRLVSLSDGSTVQLGPASAIAIHYTKEVRRVELLSGIGYFAVAPMAEEERRPFVVEAANGSARALGTQFMVNRLPQSVEVTVVEHAVEVALANQEGPRRQIVVSSGQSVRYAEAGLRPVKDVRPDLAAAWRDDNLVFDQMPLGDAVAELNRYRHGRIVITNTALASRTVSGVFETRNPEATLATITHVLGIRTASIPPLVTLLY